VGYLPFGGGERRCLGEPLAQAYFSEVAPVLLRAFAMRSVWPREEHVVLRGTILLPQHGAPVVVTARSRAAKGGARRRFQRVARRVRAHAG
jgi:cytochrome P450